MSTSAAPARILVVDDDPTVAEVVTGYLRRAGHTALHAPDGPTALAEAAAGAVDLVVLDLMLPGIDGLEVCRRLRADRPLPVIMLTARGDEEDRIAGLEMGADDYVTKPFSPRELVLRVDSVLRRARSGPGAPAGLAGVLHAAGLTVDTEARRATKGAAELTLTLREFDLLAWFLAHPGRAHGREELMRVVWGWEFGDLSTVTVHVRRLRAKIEDDPAAPRLIRTVWGVGYRFDPPPGTPEAAASYGPGGSRDSGGHPPPEAAEPPTGGTARTSGDAEPPPPGPAANRRPPAAHTAPHSSGEGAAS